MPSPLPTGADLPSGPRGWAGLAPEVPPSWFLWPDRAFGIHGITHIQRVYVHALRLTAVLEWPDERRRLALQAALWHDIGRTHDGVEHEHGATSAGRVRELGLGDELVRAGRLSPAGLELVLFAIHHHSLGDETARRAARRLHTAVAHAGPVVDAAGPVVDAAGPVVDAAGPAVDPAAALDLLWLLKDADALDRVRLGRYGDCDPRYLRHPEAVGLIDFAWELLALLDR